MVYSIRKSVYIGIGGAGTSVVRSAKEAVLEIYGKLPPFLKFLAIDSDVQNESGSLKLDAGREFLHLTVAKTMQARESQQLLNETYPKKNVSSMASKISTGCGQIRGNGRLTLLFENNYRSVIDLLKSTFIEVNKASDSEEFKSPDSPLDVYIISSIAGGTGSGMLVDIAILVNLILLQDNIEYTPPTAILFLPDLYGRKPFTKNIHGNAYATLKEIDFILDANVKDVKYPDDVKKVDFALFSKIGVVDNLRITSSGTLSLPDNENAEKAIGKALVVLSGSLGTDTAKVWDNAQGQLSTVNCEGKKQFFAGIGICELVFDANKLLRLASSRAIIKIIDKTKEGMALTYEQSLNILKGWQLREDRKEKQDQVINRILAMKSIPEPESLDKRDLSKNMTKRLENIRNNYVNTLKTKSVKDADVAYSVLEKDFQSKITEFHIDEIHKTGGITRLKSFYEVIKGYASACQLEMAEEIGTSTTSEFGNPFTRQLEMVSKEYKEIEDSIDREISSWITSKKELNSLADEYRNLIRKEITCELEIIRRDRAHTFYVEMEKIAQTSIESLQIIESRLSNIKSAAVKEETNLINRYNSFNEFILDIGKKYTDDSIAKPNEDIFNTFNSYLTSNNLIDSKGIHNWASIEPDKIIDILNDFTNKSPVLANPILDITIDKAFRGLPDSEKEEIVNNMKDYASPLWNPDRYPAGFNPEVIALFGILDADPQNETPSAICDRGADEVTWLDKLRPKGGKLQLVSTNDSKRYVYMNIEAAGPAFAIGKVKNYQTKFNDHRMSIEFLSNQVWKTEMDKLGYDVFPVRKDEETIKNWALACVFELIKRDSTISKHYIVKSSKGEQTGKGWGYYNLKTVNRGEAFQIFAEDEVLKKDIKDQITTIWQLKGADVCLAEIQDYLIQEGEKGYLKKMGLKKVTYDSDSYASTKKQMIDEIRELEKVLNQ